MDAGGQLGDGGGLSARMTVRHGDRTLMEVAMKVEWVEDRRPPEQGEHVLVFAEVGFSALSIYGHAAGLETRDLARFAEAVNQRDETGTLLPRVPLSAVPRRAVREITAPSDLEPFVTELLEELASGRVAAQVLRIDFATPGLGALERAGVLSALERGDDARLERLTVRIITGP